MAHVGAQVPEELLERIASVSPDVPRSRIIRSALSLWVTLKESESERALPMVLRRRVATPRAAAAR